jgi:septum formation protein
MRNIILASTSPRRKALLEQLGLKFKVDARALEDTGLAGLEPGELVKAISLKKAESVAGCYPDAIIIAADTVGIIEGRIIGKPHTQKAARAMLTSLSGKAHTVITGFTVLDTANRKIVTQSVETTVWMKRLTASEIESYVATGEPLDKAGAYAIQRRGAALVEKIDGDFFNVVGLPLYALAEVLKELGINVL